MKYRGIYQVLGALNIVAEVLAWRTFEGLDFGALELWVQILLLCDFAGKILDLVFPFFSPFFFFLHETGIMKCIQVSGE